MASLKFGAVTCILNAVNNGRIVERGSHEELMKKDGLYKDFVQIKNSDIGWCKRKIG